MRVVLARPNPLVGDLTGNADASQACRQAEIAAADLVLTPELSLWGYPPRDLLLRPSRLRQQRGTADAERQPAAGRIRALLVGAVWPIEDDEQPSLNNVIVQVDREGWQPVAVKQLLPNYDVFDERRYFSPGFMPDQAQR